MRILVVGINYAPDLIGVAKYNTELCEALADFGHEVRVVTAPPYYPEWRVPESYRGRSYSHEFAKGVSITRAPIYVPEKPTGAKRLLHHTSFAVTSFWPVLMTSLRWRPDVIFSVAPSLMSAALPAWIARRTGALSWLHLQDFEIDAAFDLGLLANTRLRASMIAVERMILRSFDRVSTISPQMLERLATKGVAWERIREIRNWVDTGQIAPGIAAPQFRKEQLNLDERHFICLYSGTMSNKQGLDLIVEAAKILDKIDSNIRFVLCGEGPHKGILQRLASGLNNIQFLKLQTDQNFVELLKAADVHLIPQRAEAADLVLPSKLGGILASGKPVIVMAKADTGLALEVQNAGIVIPPGNVAALADAVRALAENPELCSSLARAARATALSRWDKMVILRALQQMLKASTKSEESLATSKLPSPHREAEDY
jgi:colanic acid biosynthesis glycosyl transferase WcaI